VATVVAAVVALATAVTVLFFFTIKIGLKWLNI
jgi:hypothetical protein